MKVIDYEQLILQYSADHIDLAASTVAFVELLQKQIDVKAVVNKIPQKDRPLFMERLAHYRKIYRPYAEIE